MGTLDNLVEQLAKPFWEELCSGYAGYQRRLLAAYRRDAALGDGTFKRPGVVYKGRHSSAAHVLRCLVDLANPDKDRYRFDAPMRIKADVDQVIERESKRHADDVVSTFKGKLLGKMRGIVVDGEVEGEVVGDLGNNRVQVRVASLDMTFELRSQIVTVFSSWARPHHRYPTTYHNVSVGGKLVGRKLSEDEIKQLAAELRGARYVPVAQQTREAAKTTRAAQRAARIEKDRVKRRKALERALKRCEQAVVDCEEHSAQCGYDEQRTALLHFLTRNGLEVNDAEQAVLDEEPKLSLDNVEAAPVKLKAMRKVIREARKNLVQYEAGTGPCCPSADFQRRMADSIRENLIDYEKRLARIEAAKAVGVAAINADD